MHIPAAPSLPLLPPCLSFPLSWPHYHFYLFISRNYPTGLQVYTVWHFDTCKQNIVIKSGYLAHLPLPAFAISL